MDFREWHERGFASCIEALSSPGVQWSLSSENFRDARDFFIARVSVMSGAEVRALEMDMGTGVGVVFPSGVTRPSGHCLFASTLDFLCLSVGGRELSGRISRFNEVRISREMVILNFAQGQFQSSRAVDMDSDGLGEYALLYELLGLVLPRRTPEIFDRGTVQSEEETRAMDPIRRRMYSVWPDGRISAFGHWVCIFLPGSGGHPHWVSEFSQQGGGADALGWGSVDSERAETHWCAYAIPIAPYITSSSAFVTGREFHVSSSGDVLKEDLRWPPSGWSAYRVRDFEVVEIRGESADGGLEWLPCRVDTSR